MPNRAASEDAGSSILDLLRLMTIYILLILA